MKAVGGQRGGLVRKVRIARREHPVVNAEFRIAAEAAAGAELLKMQRLPSGAFALWPVPRSFKRGGARNSIRLAVPILRSTRVLDFGRGRHGKNKFRQDHH